MTKRSLVVGINDYPQIDATGNSNLTSCVADAADVQNLLTDAFDFDATSHQNPRLLRGFVFFG